MMNPLSRPVLSLSVGVAVIILVSLGTWQVKRLAWKEALIEAVEGRRASPPRAIDEVVAEGAQLADIEYTPVSLSGQWDDGPVVLAPGTWEGQSGYYAFSVFNLVPGSGAADRVLINRGFVPFDAVPADFRFSVPEGVVTVDGLVRQFAPDKGLAARLSPAPDTEKPIVYHRSYAGFSTMLDAGFRPYYVDSLEPKGALGTPIGGTTRIEFSNNHLGYAVTWYGLAICLLGVYAAMMRRTGQSIDNT